ncbi:cytochrome P450 (plasmid) [Actinacidiphila glaucinigra]|uniref:cytochrome P450 family protein n=1 Tax=Actinacidiphila glaucinigra TaxID=235986 RepID=UPI002DDC32B9|nr:cytochrome P450 [Actinacidiphila glaucinigra]WSD65904.1 cytochrome P450 [Actinacidiphila glaucinigra]
MADASIRKDAAHWQDNNDGLVPEDWPQRPFFLAQNLLNADGDRHARLRGPIQKAFTAARVRPLRPRIEAITDALLDNMESGAAGVIDLRAQFALPLPMTVICELLGVPDDPAMRDRFHRLSAAVLRMDITPEESQQTWQEFPMALQGLVDLKRAKPGEDLTTDLISACDAGSLSPEEVVANLLIVVLGGHETTVNLLNSAVLALHRHPDQLQLLLEGAVGWEQAVQETLRYDAPVRFTMPRYTTSDMEVEGTVIPKGSLVIVPITATGRCPHAFSGADTFDLRRSDSHRNLAFGYGAHRCPGAALAVLEAEIALSRLFTRFPDLRLASDQAPPRTPAPGVNSISELPVILRPVS